MAYASDPEIGLRLARFVRDLKPEDIPDTARETAALLLLDTLGIAIADTPMDAGIAARETAFRLYGAGTSADTAHMMFDGRPASLAGAAFATASQIDNLDGHDGYNPTKGHIGVAVVPALVAVAEHLPDLSGPEALTALTLGYEIAGRAGLSLHASVSDYHTSGAWNGLGVAALAARLRGTTPEHLREAWGIAEYHGPRSQMMREIANPTMLHDGSAMGALVGMSSVIMAEMGFTGAPAITLEAAEAEAFWADLGQFWQVEHQYIKPYPICRWAHAPIDAARELCIAHDVTATQIERIEIASFKNAVQLFPTMPDTTSQAQYALAFPVATMIAHGEIGLEHISGKGLRDPRVADLVARTLVTESPTHEARFPISRSADVTLTLKDGRVLASGDVDARGGPERPFTAADIEEKYLRFAVPVLGETRARDIRDACLNLTTSKSKFEDLRAILIEPPAKSAS